ncbi:hypothetical protein SAMN04490194_4885 [Pseudomonas migulae]|uniref:Uncharacterized protein n=1 Tax=Pseudomonas migulae TaxID=78543 RepID=A0A1H5MLW2_9PSED|nr:hypothetical protein SAMN04490194_4885 [Pseudomonas migulae]
MSARTGWLAGRHRQQAGSYEVSVCPREQVGCQAAIASKPAPTRSAYVGENRPAVRPPSPASRLLQDQRMSARTGRLSGRHRQQAGSYKISVCRREQAGCQAAIASKPAPTRSAYVGENRPAVRPPSPASRLLQDQRMSARTGRLSGRHRQQAGSYKISVCRREQAGCQAAIASKPAPTRSAYVGENRPAVRPPSPASRLLQDQRMSARTGRLSGRHRQQAGAYKSRSAYTRFSPLIRPSVSSPAALDLDPPAPSGG